MRVNSITAFMLGPLASVALVVVLLLFAGLVSRFQGGLSQFILGSGILLLWSLVYSYAFTVVFGLPVYWLFLSKNWLSWASFNLGAVVAVLCLGIVMLFLRREMELLLFLPPVLLFALCNANLMWYLQSNTVNKRSRADA